MSSEAEPVSSGAVGDGAACLQEVLERIATGIGVEAEVQVRQDGETLTGEYLGHDLGPLIGHHGQTIDSIQHLGYRERRAVALKATADQAAETAIHDGRPVALEVMSALERKVVHEHLKTRHDVETYSEGQEPERRLVVAPVVE
jgi:spoIIIJ-associated protein